MWEGLGFIHLPAIYMNTDIYVYLYICVGLGRWRQTGARALPLRSARNPKPQTQKPKPEVSNPKPEISNPKPETRNPKPETRNPKPKTLLQEMTSSGEKADEDQGWQSLAEDYKVNLTFVCNVTRFAPHKAPKLIMSRHVDF